MGLLRGRRRGEERMTGTARVLSAERPRSWSELSAGAVLDIALDHFGSERYALRLEVRVAGRPPYEVDGQWKVPNRALGRLGTGGVLAAGLELPVQVDADGADVQIDWDAWRAQPGQQAQLRDAQARRRNAGVAAMVAGDPAGQREHWRQGAMRARHWAGAVRAGGMTPEDLDRHLDLEVECGRMDPADAAAARASLD